MPHKLIWVFLALCECLDCADSCVFSYIFFFFSAREQYPHMGSLFTYCSCTVHALKNIKNGSHNTIHAFKNYLLQYFQFLVFSFSNNKLNPNGPYKYASLADVIWDIYLFIFVLILLFWFILKERRKWIRYRHKHNNANIQRE